MGKLVLYDRYGNEVDWNGDIVTLDATLSPDEIECSYTCNDKSMTIESDEVTLRANVGTQAIYALTWDVMKGSIKDLLTPKNIFHNRKTMETIVLWKDGTKTVVKPMEGTPDSEMSYYSAFTAALAKKIYGSNTQVNKIVSQTTEPVKRKERLNKIIESMGDEG